MSFIRPTLSGKQERFMRLKLVDEATKINGGSLLELLLAGGRIEFLSRAIGKTERTTQFIKGDIVKVVLGSVKPYERHVEFLPTDALREVAIMHSGFSRYIPDLTDEQELSIVFTAARAFTLDPAQVLAALYIVE